MPRHQLLCGAGALPLSTQAVWPGRWHFLLPWCPGEPQPTGVPVRQESISPFSAAEARAPAGDWLSLQYVC